jgi:hypothetical protein
MIGVELWHETFVDAPQQFCPATVPARTSAAERDVTP